MTCRLERTRPNLQLEQTLDPHVTAHAQMDDYSFLIAPSPGPSSAPAQLYNSGLTQMSLAAVDLFFNSNARPVAHRGVPPYFVNPGLRPQLRPLADKKDYCQIAVFPRPRRLGIGKPLPALL